MRRKGMFTILTAVFMVLAFSAVTFAANQVVLKTTVPNIPLSTCFKAGTDTMEMDHLTKMNEGDKITFTLTNGVTVCKNINFFLSLGTGGAVGVTADLAVSASNAGDLLVPVGLVGGTDIGFVVKATNGDLPANQVVTLELRSRVILTGVLQAANPARTIQFNAAGGDPSTDRLIIKLFDGKTTATQLYKPDALGAYIYNSATASPNTFVPEDNALCIDTLTQPWSDGANVENTPDSLPGNPADKLGFSGDYRIAHILGSAGQQFVSCGPKVLVGHIKIGVQGAAQAGADTCTSFDFETAGDESAASNGYCNDHASGNRMIIQSTTPFEVANYTVKMQIMVERAGAAKAIPGAYWSSTNLLAGGFASLASACAGVATVDTGAAAYQRLDGTSSTPRAAAIGSCDLTAAQKAVTLTTPLSALGISAGQTFLFLDLPPFNYDPDEIQAGDVVKVRVTVTGAGCSAFTLPDFTVGTFGCALAPTSGALLFPYFTGVAAGDWWNGIVVVNTGSTAGTATLTVHEKDGSVGTFTTPSIPAGSMFVDLLENIIFTGTGLGGNTTGLWIGVTTTGISSANVDGFGMMANGATSEAMGYLPRK